MELRDSKIRKGMGKSIINDIISEWITLADDIYMGDKHKHNWKCKCGNMIEGRTWCNIRSKYQIRCNECRYNEVEDRYRNFVNGVSGYTYIRSYRCNDVLPSGKVVKDNPYIKIRHDLCGRVYIVGVLNFINNGNRCIKCCPEYKDTIGYYIENDMGLKIEDVVDINRTKIDINTTSKYAHKYIWAKCLNKKYHKSYKVRCDQFVRDAGCPSCNPKDYKKLHPYDSFGYHNFDKVMSWHPDNDISPFRISKMSGRKFQFICPKCETVFKRKVSNVANRHVYCKECSMSKGEKTIAEWLKHNDIEYKYEKEFEGLVGVYGGNLSYDFYIKKYNLLIEYQGGQHLRFIIGMHKSYDNFKKQQEHDGRKRQYALENKYNLLEIFEEDFNNIEEILNTELINKNKLI